MEGFNYKVAVSRVALRLKGSNKQLTLLVEGLLIVFLMSQLAGLGWQVVQGYFAKTSLAPTEFSRRVKIATQQTQSHSIQVERLELFGQEQPEKTEVKQKPDNIAAIPRSRLPIKLTGLLAHPDAGSALAIIDSRGRQQSYRVGDFVRGNQTKIVEIYPDRVIVEDQGRKQALMLYPKQKASTVLSVKSDTSVNSEPSGQKNLGKITEFLNITPVSPKGRLMGFRINPGSNPQRYLQSGLKINDLVIAINGTDLTDPAGAEEIVKNLDAFERIDLTVEREGMLYQVELSL